MAHTDSDLSDLLAALKAGEMTDTIRMSLEWILQELIEAEASVAIGARPHQRTETRTTQRNGHRPRLLSTPAGDVELRRRSPPAPGPAARASSKSSAGRWVLAVESSRAAVL